MIELPGIIDMHVHYGPAPVPPGVGVTHSVTAIEATREAAAAGFAAIVLKASDRSTAGLGDILEEVVEGIRVFGGVVLDRAVGGLNPYLVEQTMLLGGKIVWLPTSGSRNDAVLYGGKAADGIAVTDDDGKPVAAVKEIFELILANDAILATGHITAEEHFGIARAFGNTGRVLVTHAGESLAGPALNAAQCAELAELGAIIEFSAQTCVDAWGREAMSIEDHVAMIRAAGVGQSILSTDYGWNNDLPHPAQGMLDYCERLWAAGFSMDELRQMACDTPARLLGIA